MKLRALICLGILAVFCGRADALMHTFTFDSNPTGFATTPLGTPLAFDVVDGAFNSGNNAIGGEITSPFSFTFAADGDLYTLDNIAFQNVGAGFLRFAFFDAEGDEIFFRFDGDILNGNMLSFSSQTSFTNLIQAVGGDVVDAVGQTPPQGSGGSVEASLTAIPEPSAFGFGALALSVAGLGRWVRRRFRS